MTSALQEMAKALSHEIGSFFSPEESRAATTAMLAALDRAGWQCVPKVATDDMVMTGIEAGDAWETVYTDNRRSSECIWEAMLAAAPKPE